MLDDIYPFKHNYLDLKGLKYHYLDEGEGEPIVMLHGNPTWSFYYRNLVKAFSQSHRTIVPDHIGCGYSDKPKDRHYPYTLSRRVEDLEHLLNHLNLKENITLIVHDWGGMIGATFATRYPERIKRLVILNTAGFHLPKGKKFPAVLKLFRNRLTGPIMARGLNLFVLGSAYCCAAKGLKKEIRQAYIAPYDSWKNRIAIHRFVEDIPLKPSDRGYEIITETESRLPLLKDKPMLICWGEKDFIFDNDFLRVWKEKFPAAQLHTFHEGGHYILEDEGDKIIQLINEFLKK